MIFSEYMCAVGDHFRLNQYGFKKYLIPDGKKHPFALICPGGGYSLVLFHILEHTVIDFYHRKHYNKTDDAKQWF